MRTAAPLSSAPVFMPLSLAKACNMPMRGAVMAVVALGQKLVVIVGGGGGGADGSAARQQ